MAEQQGQEERLIAQADQKGKGAARPKPAAPAKPTAARPLDTTTHTIALSNGNITVDLPKNYRDNLAQLKQQNPGLVSADFKAVFQDPSVQNGFQVVISETARGQMRIAATGQTRTATAEEVQERQLSAKLRQGFTVDPDFVFFTSGMIREDKKDAHQSIQRMNLPGGSGSMLQSVYSVSDGDRSVMGFVVKVSERPEIPGEEFMKLMSGVQKMKFLPTK